MVTKNESETQSGYREIFIRNEFIDYILAGTKTLEVRPEDRFTKGVQIGETITLSSQSRSVNVKVLAIREYQNVNDITAAEDTNKIWPGKTPKALIDAWEKVYEGKDIQTILVLEIEKIKENS